MGFFANQRSCPPTILRAYKNGDYTDLKINCGPYSFDVHQVVVCTVCDFLKQSLRFGKEAEEKCIDLPEDDPEMIRRLIAYLYLGDYDPCRERDIETFDSIKQYDSITLAASTYHSRYHKTGGFGGFGGFGEGPDPCACLAPNRSNLEQAMSVPQPFDKPADYAVVEKSATTFEVDSPLTIHATMYALADKYQVDGLGKLAKEKFESCLHHHINSEDFVNAVQIIYGTTPESNLGLRSVVVKAFQTYFNVDISRIPGVEAKLETIDELSFLLMKSWPIKSKPAKPAASPSAKPAPSSNAPFGSVGFGQSASSGGFGQSASSAAFGQSASGGGFGQSTSGGGFGQSASGRGFGQSTSNSGSFGGASATTRPT